MTDGSVSARNGGNRGPHAGQPVEHHGEAAENARAGLIMLHGRGAGASDMLSLAASLELNGVAVRAPQAAGNAWYPQSFLAPVEENQPFLDSALSVITSLVEELGAAGIDRARVFLLGFSQGGCLSLEYAARHPGRYAGVFALSGGLIGPPGGLPEHRGDMEETPVFIGCSDRDPFIPKERVEESAARFESLGARVDMRLYPNMPHTINEDEIEAINRRIRELQA